MILLEATTDAPRALSQDGDDRPTIPAALFPLTLRSAVLRDGFVFDPEPVTAALDPPVSGVAPASVAPTHFFNIFAVSSEFGAPGTVLPGRYTLPSTIVDQTGAGYSLEARFTISCDAIDRVSTPSECGFRPDAGAPTDAVRDAEDVADVMRGGPLGSPCAARSDCEMPPGRIVECLQTHAGLTWREGYCSLRCGPEMACPSGSPC